MRPVWIAFVVSHHFLDRNRLGAYCSWLCLREFSQMKKMLSELKDAFCGKPAAVLGGGPSLPDDIKRLPKDAIMIAVNYHGFYHCPPDHQPMFMVYNDAPETNPLQLQAVREHRAIHVSPEPSTDIVFDVPDVWTGFYSSNTAAWFALYIGCDPVILCGMDCYQGPVKHCPPSDYHSSLFDRELDFHIRPWVEDCKHSVPHPERLRAMSGPLTTVFEPYKG